MAGTHQGHGVRREHPSPDTRRHQVSVPVRAQAQTGNRDRRENVQPEPHRRGIDEHHKELFDLYLRLLESEVNYKGAWTVLVEKAGEIAGKAKDAVGNLLDVLGDASFVTDAWIDPATRAVTTMNELAGKASGSIELTALRTEVDACLAAYGSSLDDGARQVTELRDTVGLAKVHIALLRSLQAAEIDTLHRLFREQRQKMAEFVKPSPLEKAGGIKNATKQSFDSWISSLRSHHEGMEKDAERLRDDVLTAFGNLETGVITTAYNTLKSQHEGVFLGAVSDAAVKTLAQSDIWASLRSQVASVKFAENLRALKIAADRPDLSIESAVTALASAVANRADPPAGKDAFRTAVTKRGTELATALATRRADLTRVVDDGVTALDGPELTGLLNRRDVERSLTS